jgi:arylsulfatase
VIFAQGSRFGGHALFIKDHKLFYVNNFLGIPPEQRLVSNGLTQGHYVMGMEFNKEGVGEHHETLGKGRLYINDKVVAEGEIRTQPGHFALCGEGLCVGRDSGDSVSDLYKPQFAFTGGVIKRVEINVGNDQYIDLEREAAAMMARE